MPNPETTTPAGSMALLARARSGLQRVTPHQAFAEQQAGAHLVDLRMPQHRADGGELPGALVIDLTVLPWRLDPGFDWRIPEATSTDVRWILFCRHGYASSLAAWNLQQLGLTNVTDIIGGFDAWRDAGLPAGHGPVDLRP